MKNFSAKDWKRQLPIPVCEDEPGFLELYDKAWELARTHVRSIPGMPQDPYMDEAFCDTQIWIWDTCFMAQFCKYARGVFPGVESLNNFYEVLYGTGRLPKIVPSAAEPCWTNAIPGVKNDIFIHIADNPPLFAWCEYENILFSADQAHLQELLYEKRYLQKHYEWIETLAEQTRLPGVFLPTHLKARELGYLWEGGASGMDNTPRGRAAAGDGKERPNNPDMLWVDAICQQALSAGMIANLFSVARDEENAKLWREKFQEKRRIVNTHYWDSCDRFYYDIDGQTGRFCRVMTVASYWAMTAGIATRDQAEALVSRLQESETLGGEIPLISLARNDGDYRPDGGYWRGALWIPTAYAALKGLSTYGFHSQAHDAAYKILSHMLATYREYSPHTIWECYAPEKPTPGSAVAPGTRCRPDFCGWSALGPISMFIEFVLGFRRINAFEKTVEWEKPARFSGEIGIKNLTFDGIVTDIVAHGRACHVVSNGPYTLVINGTAHPIQAGANEITLT